MKARIILIAAALTALTLFSGGCKKHTWRPEPGTQIQFRAVSDASARPAQTKTSYSGVYFATESAADYVERVDWVQGDKISIGYVVKTDGTFTYAESDDYVITDVTESDVKSLAKLAPTGGPYGGNGLTWQEGTYHGFYATYPTCRNIEGFEFGIENNTVKYNVPCEYPKEQVVTLASGKEAKLYNGTEYILLSENVYEPDMRYAWYLANGSWTGLDGTINLSFESHVTAFEFTVDCADDVEDVEGEPGSLTIASFELTDANAPLSGIYIWSVDNSGQTSDTPSEDVSNKVKVWFNAAKEPITLTKGSPITFTVLTSCVEMKKAMTITFNLLDGNNVPVTRSLKLMKADTTGLNIDGEGEKNYGVHFSNSWKHRIYGLKIPKNLTPDGWFDATDAGGYINQDW